MLHIPHEIVEDLRGKLDPTPCNIVQGLVSAGHEAYIVGGALRDLLLGVPPKDYDIATSATPEEIRQVFGRRRCHIIGRRFRLVHVYANGEPYEVSTFRRVPTAKERQGLRPSHGQMIWNDNSFGTLEEDATRRDFTANSLYFDVAGPRGLIDFWGGYQDIQDRVVRPVGQPAERLEEDPVRMLRALKLVGQFGFHLESGLDAAIRRQAKLIRLASPSRLFEELLKILKNPAADQTLEAFHQHGFLTHFWNLLDSCWEDQEGKLVRHLLKLRGAAIRRGNYSNSRGLALATVAVPFIMTAMNPENPTEFWSGSLAYNPIAHQALKLVFEDFQLPKAFVERILDIIGLLPQMLSHDRKREKLFQHVEYRYGRALLALLVQAFGWNGQEILSDLPEFSPAYGNWLGDAEEDADLPSSENDHASLPEPPEMAEPGTFPENGAKPRAGKRRRRSRKPRLDGHGGDAAQVPDTIPPEYRQALPEATASEAHAVESAENATPSEPDAVKVASPRLLALPRKASKAVPAPQTPADASHEPKLMSLRKDGQRPALPATVPAKHPETADVGASFILATPRNSRSDAIGGESITFSPADHLEPTTRKRLKPLTSKRKRHGGELSDEAN